MGESALLTCEGISADEGFPSAICLFLSSVSYIFLVPPLLFLYSIDFFVVYI